MQMFAAHERFDPSSGESWKNYIEWSGFKHIQELVSTDSILCPSVIGDLIDEDWDHNIHEDFKTYFFHGFEYLKQRIGYDPKQHNLLSIITGPSSPTIPKESFEFCGYDILDSDDSISVLTNCGEFPEIFTRSELNKYGLLNELPHADRMASVIREKYPDEHHCCDCRVWSLSRYTGL